MAVKVNKREFDQLMKGLSDMPKKTVRTSGKYFKKITPRRTGNAQNKTKTYPNQLTIDANYGYAGPLDEGRSRQAPNGMSEPTIEIMEQYIEGYLRNI